MAYSETSVGRPKTSGPFSVGDHISFDYRGSHYVGTIRTCGPYGWHGSYEVECVRTKRKEKRTRRFIVDGSILTMELKGLNS